jgi:predicted GNAT family N-acyltransferase
MLASGVSTSLVEQFQQATKDVLKVDRFPNSTFDQRSIDYLEEYQKLAPIIRRQLKESIGQVLQTEIESRPKVEVQSVADLNDNKRYFPFGVPDGRNMGLLFQRMHSPEIKSHLEQDLNIKLEDIPFRSQLHLLSYLCEQNHSAFKRLREVLKKHPNDATTILTTFLSYSEGQNFVEPILVIAENIPQKNALFIFKKYADIAKEVDTIRSFIRKNFDGVTATEEKVNTVAGNLIRQANQLLLEAGQVVRAGNPNEIDVILKKFDRAKGEVSLFASVYKLLAKEVAASLLSLPGVTLSKVSAKELSSEEVGQVSAISLENCRAQYPEAYAKIVHENFIKSLSDSTTNLYLLRVESQIVSFLRSSPTEKTNTIYLGSFNTDSLLKGSGLGFPLFQEVLRLEGGKTVRAVSHPKNPNLEKYLESYGFKIVGQQDKGDGIEKSVVIERPAEVK